MPTYIVTGATGGIGRAIVSGLAREKAPCHIILAVRDTSRGEEIAHLHRGSGIEVSVTHLDLASLASVVSFASEIKKRDLVITTLFNNAGTMPGGVTITEDGIEVATQTNFLATALLTELLLPLISDNGSIVFTTSVTRHICRLHRDWSALAIKRHQRFVTYGRSKLMLTHYALDLALRLKRRGIRVNCSDPGVADTSIITLGHPLIDRLADTLLRPLIHTPAQGAAAALRAAFSPESAQIFTHSGISSIPAGWLHTHAHQALMEDLQSVIQNKFYN